MSLQPPPINTYGVFTVISPFTIDNVDYRCSAIQLISSLAAAGIDVYNLYYLPFKISNEAYQTDVANNVAIVTLLSDSGPDINIPSSFISNAPVEISIPYSKLVISIDIGELPDSLTLTPLLTYLETVVNGNIGVIPTINLHKIPIKKRYNANEARILEATRLAKVTNLVSFYTSKIAVDIELAKAKERITALENILNKI